jgi:hypothetical protein
MMPGFPPHMPFGYPPQGFLPGFPPYPMFNPHFHTFSQLYYPPQPQPPPSSTQSTAPVYNATYATAEKTPSIAPLMSLNTSDATLTPNLQTDAEETQNEKERKDHNLDDEYENFLLVTGQKEISTWLMSLYFN